MKKTILTIFQYGFFLGLGIFFAWLSLRSITQEDWVDIKTSIARARHWLILPVVGLLLLSHYFRALRWKILMEPMGYRPSTFNTFAAVMIGYLVNTGVPRLGEVVKCTLLSKYENVRADRLVGTIVMERVVDMICLIIVFIAALVIEGEIIGDFVKDLFAQFFQNAEGNISFTRLAITIGGAVLVLGLLYFGLKRFGHIDVVAKIKNVVKGMLQGLSSIRHIKQRGRFLFQSILIWLLYLGSTTMGIYALRETAHLGIGGGLTTLAVGSVGMIVTPGGIGAYPLLVAQLMGLYGLNEATIGNALGWLLWSVQTLIVIGAGLVFAGLFTYYNKKRKKIESGKFNPNEDPDPGAVK